MSVETAAKRSGKLSFKLLDMKFMKKPGDSEPTPEPDTQQESDTKSTSASAGPDPGAWSMPSQTVRVKKVKPQQQLGYSDLQSTKFPVGRQLWKNGKCQDVRELEREATPEIELDPELPSKKRKSDGKKQSAKKHARKK